MLIFAGLFVLWLFGAWEHRVEKRGAEPLVRLSMLGNRQFSGGLVMFFFQFLIQAGLFFTIPLYLSVALGLSAIDTGIKIIPLSVTLLIAVAGIPRFFPDISPRLVVQAALLALLALIALFFSGRIPTRQPGSARTRPSEPHPGAAGAQTPDRPEQATTVTGTT